jgi:CHAT domain
VTVIELAIAPGHAAGSFRVEVVRSPAGEASAEVVLDVEALLARREEIENAVLASSITSRGVVSQVERPLREIGQTLFTALLGSGDISGRYRASAALAAEQEQGLRVVLRIDTPALAGLPWEAMYDAVTGGYVCRREPLVRQVPVASPVPPLAVQLPLRILGIISSPRGLGLLDADREKEQLTRALARPCSDGLIEVHWAADATWATLQDYLLSDRWHVLHFIGHGDFDIDQDEGGLFLTREDGRPDLVEANQLVDLLREARPMPRLVVLNSCSGATTGVSDLFAGTAAALVRGGVSSVAAMQWPISDGAACAFARGFYTAIAHGRGVDEATRSGRVAIVGTHARTLEWVTPVMYLRGHDSRLFILNPQQRREPIPVVRPGSPSAPSQRGADLKSAQRERSVPQPGSQAPLVRLATLGTRGQYLDAWALRQDGAVHHWWWPHTDGSQEWSTPEVFAALPSAFGLVADIAVASSGPGRAEVFAVDRRSNLWYRRWRQDEGWADWEMGTHQAASPVAACSLEDGHVGLVMAGQDARTVRYGFDQGSAGWSPWTTLDAPGGPQAAALTRMAAVGVRGQSLNIWALRADGKISHWSCPRSDAEQTWNEAEDWIAPGGTVDIAAASRGPGHAEVFAVDRHGNLWHRWWLQDEGWAEWQKLIDHVAAPVAACSYADGHIQVFVTDPESDVIKYSSSSVPASWDSWKILG